MKYRHGFSLWAARILLTLLALILLLPMVQTFLYSFSSIPEIWDSANRHGSGILISTLL